MATHRFSTGWEAEHGLGPEVAAYNDEVPAAARLPSPLEDLAASQRGYLSLRQATEFGLTRGDYRGLVARGDLTVVAPRTLRCRGADRGWRGEASALLLWAGEEAALCLASCARMRGIRDVPASALFEVMIPYAHHHHLVGELRRAEFRLDGRVRLVRSRSYGEVDRALVDGLRTTTVPRLMVDTAQLLSPGRHLALLDQVVGARRTTLSAVHGRALALRRGRGGLAPLIAATQPGAAQLFRSWLERYGMTLVVRAGIRGFETNVPVMDSGRLVAELDAYCAEANLPLEFDGMRSHAPPRAARKERERGNRLRGLGIVPLRYTYLDLLEEPERMIREIVSALRAAGCGHLVGPPPARLPPLPPLPGTRG